MALPNENQMRIQRLLADVNWLCAEMKDDHVFLGDYREEVVRLNEKIDELGQMVDRQNETIRSLMMELESRDESRVENE